MTDSERRSTIERAFATAFLRSEKRGRFVELAGARPVSAELNPRTISKRRKYANMLANLEHWFVEEDSGGSVDAEEFATALRKLARRCSVEQCYVMAMSPEHDGAFLSIDQAVELLTAGDDETALLILDPIRAACYWHGEVQDVSRVLERRS